MKKLLNKIRLILIVVLVSILAVSILFDIFAEGLLKTGIETAATKTLNVGVRLADIELSVFKGEIAFEGLVVSNPPGYKYKNLLELKTAKIDVDVRTLLSDVVIIEQIKLDGITLTLEQRGVTSNNLKDIIKSIPKKPKTEKPSGRKLQIDELEITNVVVNVKLLPVPGKADTVTLKLAPIRMTNLGDDGTMDTAKLSAKILLAITEGITEQGVGIIPADILNTTRATLDKALDIGKAATEEGMKIIEKGKDIGEGIIDGIKGIFEKKDE